MSTGAGSQLVDEMEEKRRECPLVWCQDLGTEHKWNRQATEKAVTSDKVMLDNPEGLNPR